MPSLETCIMYIHQWMLVNRFKLNNDKTDFLTFPPQSQSESFTTDSLEIGTELIGTSTKAKNLGVIIDPRLSLSLHITVSCRSATYQLYCLNRIKHYLSSDVLKTAVHALISSKLDYCNSLLAGLPKHDIQKYQHIINSDTCLISGTQKHNHIILIFINLHWLPVEQGLSWSCPPYLTDLRSLHSAEHGLLSIPRAHTDKNEKGPLLM